MVYKRKPTVYKTVGYLLLRITIAVYDRDTESVTHDGKG
jgi:hypothetical protein